MSWRDQEPCLCGDPECGLCFPRYEEVDEDEAYERWRQAEIDDAAESKRNEEST